MKRTVIALVILLALLLTACTSERETGVNPDRETPPVQEDVVIPFTGELWQAHYLLENNLEIDYQPPPEEGLSAAQISGLLNKEVESIINETLRSEVAALGADSGFWSDTASYNNVFYTRFISHVGNRPVSVDFLFDLTSGQRLGLQDLFRHGDRYRETVSLAVREEMMRLNLDGDVLYRPFVFMDEDLPFVLTATSLIIEFPEGNPYFSSRIDPFSLHQAALTIPFSRFYDEVVIYSKYMNGQPLFEDSGLKKHLLPGPVTIKEHYRNIYEANYEVFVRYPELSGMANGELQEKLNSYFAGKAAAALNDHSLQREVTDRQTLNSDEEYHYGMRIYSAYATASFADIISFNEYEDRSRSWEDNSAPARQRGYVYSIESGRQLALGDLFYPDVDYLSLLNGIIAGDSHYQALIKQKPFAGITADTPFILDLSQLGIMVAGEYVYIPYYTLGNSLIFY